jgi:hypothetical protein
MAENGVEVKSWFLSSSSTFSFRCQDGRSHTQDLVKLFADAPQSVTITIMPAFIYQHLIKKIGSFKKDMDRGIPEL